MKFEIISIGNELLSGRTLNSNLQTICQKLTDIGCNVSRSYVIRDDPAEISHTLNLCISFCFHRYFKKNIVFRRCF